MIFQFIKMGTASCVCLYNYPKNVYFPVNKICWWIKCSWSSNRPFFYINEYFMVFHFPYSILFTCLTLVTLHSTYVYYNVSNTVLVHHSIGQNCPINADYWTNDLHICCVLSRFILKKYTKIYEVRLGIGKKDIIRNKSFYEERIIAIDIIYLFNSNDEYHPINLYFHIPVFIF